MARPDISDEDLAGAVERLTGVRLSDHARLRRALTHSSVRDAGGAHYERLEFLGDRVLGIVVAEMLFTAFPDAPEGELSVRLNGLVNAETLAEIAEEAGLTGLIRTAAEFGPASGRKRVNLRSDVIEALIAAIYLEGGLDAVRPFVLKHWEPRSRLAAAGRRDAKTELQEWAHQNGGGQPVYAVESREGPDHDPLFTVSVTVADRGQVVASGRSKREAEQAAAAAMLLREAVWQEDQK